jgi:methionyl aminopeptidase
VLALRPNDRCWCESGRKFKVCHQRSTESVRPGEVSPMRTVPDSIEKPEYAITGVVVKRPEDPVKPPDVLARMRRTCAAAADTLVAVGRLVAPGVTTEALDEACHAMAIEAGAYPSPLGYGAPAQSPYPKSLCTSVNEVICHGIPDSRELREGDIVNLDITLFREGVHGDTNATFVVGQTDPESQRLITVTRDCLRHAIDAVRPGEPLRVIGRAIEDHATANGFNVVRDFIGHGVGEQFHTKPEVLHYDGGTMTPLLPGMVFTIEPMIAVGSWRVRIWPDSWTAVTEDRKRTAQFEHTILVTDDGAEILTVPNDTTDHPYWAV